jgi:DNA mismatch repair ATPase MutS
VHNVCFFLVALTEGRGDARCEVGLASIDLSLPNLVLCQISDVHSYLNTLTKINILNPTDVSLSFFTARSHSPPADNRTVNVSRQRQSINRQGEEAIP